MTSYFSRQISNGELRVLFGTQMEAFVVKSKRATARASLVPSSGGSSDDESATTKAGRGGEGKRKEREEHDGSSKSWIRAFDVEINEWRSFRYETVIEVAYKNCAYPYQTHGCSWS